MAENEQKPGENIPKSPEQQEKEYHIMREWLRQLLDENKILKQRLSEYEKPLEQYNRSWSWITKIVFIITQSNRPMRFSEIYEAMKKIDSSFVSHTDPQRYLSTVLSKAKQTQRLFTHKVVGIRGDYYFIAQWIGEHGRLTEEMKEKIDWYELKIDRTRFL